MEQGLKERLVGAAVLVVLAVLFVPMVLHGPQQAPATTPTTAAPVPAGASTFRYDLTAPLPNATNQNATSAAPAAVPATRAATPAVAKDEPAAKSVPPASAQSPAAPPAATVAKPASRTTAHAMAKPPAVASTKAPAAAHADPAPGAAQPVAQSWAAQVGSFAKEATAQSVVGDLKKHGFKAFVVTRQEGTQTLYRVRVGPVATRETADALARRITQTTGQAARPVPHP